MPLLLMYAGETALGMLERHVRFVALTSLFLMRVWLGPTHPHIAFPIINPIF